MSYRSFEFFNRVAIVIMLIAAACLVAAAHKPAGKAPATWQLVVALGDDTDIVDHGLSYGDCMFEAGRTVATFSTVFCEVER